MSSSRDPGNTPSARRSFVVWIDAEPGSDPSLQGVIEHVASSTRARFTTADALLRFLMQPRAASANQPAEES